MNTTDKQRLAHNAWQVCVDLMRDPVIADIITHDILRDLNTHAIPTHDFIISQIRG